MINTSKFSLFLKEKHHGIINDMIKKLGFFVGKIISLSSHFLAFGLIYYIAQPVSNWYLSKVPILGVDFYNSVNYVTYLARHISLPANGYVDNWFSGYPLYRVFISAHWYAMIPFAKELGTVYGIQIYVLASLFLLIVFSYLLYFHLSKSRTLAFLISLFVL